MSMIPKNRWCTCTPLSDTTLPGHPGTRGLRIRRVDRRMNPNADTKPTSISKRNRRSLRLSHVPSMTEANVASIGLDSPIVAGAASRDRPCWGIAVPPSGFPERLAACHTGLSRDGVGRRRAVDPGPGGRLARCASGGRLLGGCGRGGQRERAALGVPAYRPSIAGVDDRPPECANALECDRQVWDGEVREAGGVAGAGSTRVDSEPQAAGLGLPSRSRRRGPRRELDAEHAKPEAARAIRIIGREFHQWRGHGAEYGRRARPLPLRASVGTGSRRHGWMPAAPSWLRALGRDWSSGGGGRRDERGRGRELDEAEAVQNRPALRRGVDLQITEPPV